MKKLAAGVLAYCAALLIAPEKVAGNRWLGPGARQPVATAALRGLGAREVALATLTRSGAVRPWLAAGIVGSLPTAAFTAALA